MRSILRGLSSRWVLTGFGVAAAGVMIWLYGPFLSVLDGWVPRVVAILMMSFVWVGANAAIEHIRRSADARLAAGIMGTEAGAGHASAAAAAAAGSEQVAELRERLTRALALLKRARANRGYLYEQPWYVILGPSGAGKTTALANAGLRFPLAAELGSDEVEGVGGTRFCNWSFTDEAVLIDIAGRYTTQEENPTADKAGWEGFLDLLRQTRPRQPLNGVIVAISATDVTLPEVERRAHARAVRSRIKELYAKLGARIPVYAVFTKLDQILGFSEFFDDLDQARRAQVWGVTFPLVMERNGPASRFPAEFRALTSRLSDRVIDRLQAERSPERRAAIADFPTQFASLEVPLASFVDEAFGDTLLDPASFLRGIYFASGTQQGSPIDRLTGTLARGFGIDQRRAESLRPSQGRGYFLEVLLKQVIFGEAMLLVRNPRAARRRLLVRAAAWSLAGIVSAGGVATLWYTAGNAATQRLRFVSALSDYQTAIAAAKIDPVPLAGTDLPAVAPLLDRARALPFGPHDEASKSGEFGLTDRAKLSAATNLTYRRALERILLPRLISLLEARMRAQVNDIDSLYRTTRVYLILGGFGPMDRAMVRDWMRADWATTYAGASLAQFRASLFEHLDALLAEPFGEFVQLDGGLIAQSQALISRVGIPARAYALIRSSEAAQALHPFVPADAIGALAGHYFIRRSGRPLTDPIPGFFTVAGYDTALLPALGKATEQVMTESWVLGQGTRFDPANVVARQQLEDATIALYARDYEAAWDDLLADLDVVPPADSAAALANFSVFTSPQGPIKLLLSAVVKQFDLSSPPAAPTAGTASPITAKLPSTPPPAPADGAILDVEGHYHDLREFVEAGQLEIMLTSLDRLQQQIAAQLAASAAGNGPASAPGVDAAQTLQQMAASAPQPVSRWLTTLARRGGTVRDDMARHQAAAAFAGSGGALPLCQQVVQRFPFRPAAREDVSMDDFSQLFAPNGRLDGFFTQFVRPYVDTTAKDWKLRDPASTQAPVTAEAVGQFQRALAIRDTFFAQGGTQPRVSFALRPIALDSAAHQVTLDFGGITASWSQGVSASINIIEWPGPTRMNTVRVSFDPLGTGPALDQTGPWALFRLIAHASLQRTSAGDGYQVTLTQGAREARFELTAASAHSPFDADLFAGFKCPTVRP